MSALIRQAAICGVIGLLDGLGATPALWAQRLSPPQAPIPAARSKALPTPWDKANHQAATIHAGMTRAQLLTVFTPDSGFPHDSASPVAVFECRQYPYLLVNVEFRAFRQPEAGARGLTRTPEDPRDVITLISRPFGPLDTEFPPSIPEIMSGHLGFRE